MKSSRKPDQGTASFISRTFLRGFAVLIPFFVAFYVVLWVVRDAEGLTRSILIKVLPESIYFPGLGLLCFALTTFLLGLMMYPWITRSLFELIDSILRKIPFFSSVYSPIRDLFLLFGGQIEDRLGQVVMIQVPGTEMETIGFITREDSKTLPDGMLPEDWVTVYVQWSSQIGGYCFFVPRSSIRPIDMTVEEAMRFALTAGLSAPTRVCRPDTPPKEECIPPSKTKLD